MVTPQNKSKLKITMCIPQKNFRCPMKMSVGKASATAAIDCFSMWCNNAFEIIEMLLLEGGCCGHSLKMRGLAVTRGTNLTSSLYLINCTPLDKEIRFIDDNHCSCKLYSNNDKWHINSNDHKTY